MKFFADLKVNPIRFAVFLKPEQGQTRKIADKLSFHQAWARVEDAQKRDMGKAWMMPY